MSEFTKEGYEALQKANEELLAANESLKKELVTQKREMIEGFNEQLKKIKDTVDHGGALAIRPKEPVDGVFTVKYNAEGKQVKEKVRFKDGHQRVRLANGELVSSSALMRIAEGGDATEAEVKAFPALNGLTQQQAADRITDLHKLKYPYLVKA